MISKWQLAICELFIITLIWPLILFLILPNLCLGFLMVGPYDR